MAHSNGNGADKPKVTLGAEWRKRRAEGHYTRLLSGNIAKLRTVDIYGLMQQGEIPDVLTPLAASVLFEGTDRVVKNPLPEAEEQDDSKGSRDRAQYRIDLMNLICKAAFVEPRIVDDPQADDEIGIDDVHMDDRAFVFRLALAPAEVLSRFRDESAADVEAVSQRDDAKPEAEPDAAESAAA